jgi:hypothetical protein
MYRCERCGECVGRGQTRRVIRSYRQQRHPARERAFRLTILEKGRRVSRWMNDAGGEGRQIVAEAAVCQACHEAHQPAPGGSPA